MSVAGHAPSSATEARLPVPELRQAALRWLAECDPQRKCAGVEALQAQWAAAETALDADAALAAPAALPGRPSRPELVAPAQLRKRSLAAPQGRAVLIHALAHIEFNAINLALDAVWRFPGMPRQYYADWLQVAAEEARHYTLLAGHLQALGHAYGDFPAHNGLWEMAEKTCGDILARMALIPRTLEARGLDVSPGIRERLAQAGDAVAAGILDIILRDEIGHVRIGNHWFGWLCAQRGIEPASAYRELVRSYRAPVPRGPYNRAARRAAGFSDAELAELAD